MNTVLCRTALVLIAGFASSVAGSALATANDTAMNLQIVDRHIIPAYHNLASATRQLNEQAGQFCGQADTAGYSRLREEFHNAMDAWQAIQHIRSGPVEFLQRYNRFELWPDKRNSVNKHLAQLLQEKNPSALEPVQFSRGSIAIQGFSALEVLLFDYTAAEYAAKTDDTQYRCAVIKAITANLADMATGIRQQWTAGDNAYRNFIATADSSNDFYESSRAVSTTFLNHLHTGLQASVDQKLDMPLGAALPQAMGKRAESWRSQRSLRNLDRNLRGLAEFYHFGFAPRLQDTALDKSINALFAQALDDIGRIPLPLDQAVGNPDARNTVAQLRATLSRLKALVAGPLSQQLDIPLGFNSLDGD